MKVDQKSRDWFEYALEILTSFNRDEGISTIESATALNAFFNEEGVSLEAAAYVADEAFAKGFATFLSDNLQAGNDVWIEYAVGEK